MNAARILVADDEPNLRRVVTAILRRDGYEVVQASDGAEAIAMLPSEIDVVIPIPESSRPSAMQLAQKIGKPYREGFVKNRYVGRTFIMPGQGMRKKSVRQKLNAIASEFKGRNVLLVDDSIVRGTTSKEIVQMARDAGARKVYMASAAPPVRFPNVYGIDMPTKDELIAHNRSAEEIREYIGADALIYQDVAAMKKVVGRHLSVGRRCECATQRSERQRGAHRPRAGGDVNARHCVRRRQSSPSRCRGRSRRTSRACRNPPRRSCTRRVPAR